MVHRPLARGEILIVGLGSIGRRHLRNLRALGWSNIRLLRTGLATLPDDALEGYPVERDLDGALASQPLAVIVANPTALHLPVAVAAARAGCHLLIEKPLSHEFTDVAALEEAVGWRDVRVLMGFQFRFNPGLRQLKAWLDGGSIGCVTSVHVHWGEYLPHMHPWEDHRLGYAARPELGGGVLLTLCHPFDYLRWLIGEVEEVTALETATDGELALDVESNVDLVLRLGGGVPAVVHLDFLQRPTDHRLIIVGSEGSLSWSQRDHAARRYSPLSGVWETVPAPPGFDRNTMFRDEMRHFLACVDGRARPLCTLEDGKAALRVSLAARRATEWRTATCPLA